MNGDENLNYNDRLDGYGFGEAECRDENKEYEADPHFTNHCIDLGEGYRRHLKEPYSKNELGLRNQYGPVDQYTFRGDHFFVRIHDKRGKKP
jgi:hypothetical protein